MGEAAAGGANRVHRMDAGRLLETGEFTGMRGDKDPRRTVREQRFSSLTIADAASMTKGFF
jgi:hypothetical protein